MFRLLLLVVFCLVLCGCGGSNTSATPQTSSSKLAQYQGFYAGTLENTTSGNGVGSPISFNIDDFGSIFTLYYPSTAEENVISLSFMKEDGSVHGVSLVNGLHPLVVTYDGTIDLTNDCYFDISYTYNGDTTGAFRIYGYKVQVTANILTQNSTINLGQSLTLYNNSTLSNSKYPVSDAGLLNNANYSWAVKSAPGGSLAGLDWSLSNNFDRIFTPDKKGTYIISLSVNNGSLGISTSEINLTVI